MELKPHQVEQVRNILQQHVPEAKVYAFGSRVKLTAKAHSDLDLLVVAETEIPLGRMHLLEEAFAESDLPFRVDVLDWHAISAEVREQIAACGELMWSSE
jgi:predicted nucleotidyltransferase